ncbi:hypothetical protein C4D60_Mb01t10300 [Musa balbisiana]|uniref:Uncharacterized protein n=1 Tax=Musa balbisiana TaxID=52838 RepID=A0A4V4H790_MUSBA|nr:hypothetical protein C4D60_Mb01t10300 [Musa balbisiana]
MVVPHHQRRPLEHHLHPRPVLQDPDFGPQSREQEAQRLVRRREVVVVRRHAREVLAEHAADPRVVGFQYVDGRVHEADVVEACPQPRPVGPGARRLGTLELVDGDHDEHVLVDRLGDIHRVGGVRWTTEREGEVGRRRGIVVVRKGWQEGFSRLQGEVRNVLDDGGGGGGGKRAEGEIAKRPACHVVECVGRPVSFQ